MKSKNLVWNFIGISCGLILLWIGFNASLIGVDSIEVIASPARSGRFWERRENSLQSPIQLGVILIVINVGIIFCKLFFKRRK